MPLPFPHENFLRTVDFPPDFFSDESLLMPLVSDKLCGELEVHGFLTPPLLRSGSPLNLLRLLCFRPICPFFESSTAIYLSSENFQERSFFLFPFSLFS